MEYSVKNTVSIYLANYFRKVRAKSDLFMMGISSCYSCFLPYGFHIRKGTFYLYKNLCKGIIVLWQAGPYRYETDYARRERERDRYVEIECYIHTYIHTTS